MSSDRLSRHLLPESVGRLRRRSRPRRESLIVAFVTSVISVIATVVYVQREATMLYPDSVAHMEIARRFLDSATPGFGQLGGVWLPLPHLLMQPFIWLDSLYYSGLAGSLVSMASYVVASVYIYRTIRRLDASWWAAVAGTAVFALNPNVLYMQSTPMSEVLLFAAMIASVYYVQCWVQTRDYRELFFAGIACLAGCLTRYEAWISTAVLLAVVGILAWQRKGYRRAEGTVLTFAVLAALGVVGWVIWNWMIFGNPLNWQNGEYAKSSLWVGSNEPSMGNFDVSLLTFWYAVVDNLGLIVVILSVVGTIWLVIRRRTESLPLLSLWALWLFFIVALYSGQRPLHVMEISGDLYNVRFGLVIVLPAAVAIGYLISQLGRVHARLEMVVSAVVVGALASLAVLTPTPVLVREPEVWAIAARHSESVEAAAFLREQYDDGLVLATFFGSENMFFDARIPLRLNIYEGSYKMWDAALNDPRAENVRWIVMRTDDASDAVFVQLNDSAHLSDYRLVYDRAGYRIYKEK